MPAWRGLVLVAGLALAACATPGPTGRPGQGLELHEVPFFPQAAYQCGPAALATVLAAAGEAVSPDELVAEVYLPARRGSLQAELLAATRRRGLAPVRLPPEPDAIRVALEAGQPVLVLQDLGAGTWRRWHYAVVVGWDEARRQWILRSGTQARERLSERRFRRAWERAGRWAFTVHPPDAPPAWAGADDWLDTLRVWVGSGPAEAARGAARAATARWPGDVRFWLLRGSVAHAGGERLEAARAWQQALALQPLAGAYFNLVQTLAELGCADAADAWLAEGRQRFPGDARLAGLQPAPAAARCPF